MHPSLAERRGNDMTIKRWNQGSGHSYSIDGQRATGVTTALRALPIDLVGWSARTVADHILANPKLIQQMISQGGDGPTRDYLAGLPFQKRNSAGVRGTAVHKLAEQVVTGEEVEAYIRFLDDWNPRSVASELVVASREHGYAGTLDSIQDVPELGRVQVDYKTGNGIYGKDGLQVTAYQFADCCLWPEQGELPMPTVDASYILHIQPDGYGLYPVKSDEESFETFLSVLEVYRRAVQKVRGAQKIDLLIGEPIAPLVGAA
jgi:hypothetical protein